MSVTIGLRAAMAAMALTLVPLLPGATMPEAPQRLRCEYLKDPIGIDAARPRFQWIVEDSRRGEIQTAYQIVVATSPAALGRNEGNAWDSGRVASASNSQIVYAGKPLASGQRYYWKARWWDREGNASPYSTASYFEMGLLAPSDWRAQWIGGGNELRTEFNVASPVARARAYVTALGYYELHINGKRIGHRVLDPAWTTYSKRVLYSTYDVTAALRPGANAVGALLGGGWATQKAGAADEVLPAPELLVQLEIEYTNGRRTTVGSDGAWRVTDGPITRDSVYGGESYDARRETPGWDVPGYNAGTGGGQAETDGLRWRPAEAMKSPGGTLSAEAMPPIRVVATMTPRRILNPAPGIYVYDFGQNFSGWPVLKVRGPGGTQVQMRTAELIYPNGEINRENLRGARSTDIYTLKGAGLETYEPHFTYHGFRYVEVTGFPGAPSLDSLRAREVHSDVATVGSFAASKQILNDIQRLIRWSQLTNLFSIPTDCDQRDERQGWMGDAQVTAEEAMMNFDMGAFYTNFIRDIADAQHADGSVPDTVPHRYGGYPADPAWGTAYPLLCWYMWQQYGDRRILESNYEGLKRYVDFLSGRAPNGVLTYSYYGDWVATEPTPGALVSDFYYYWDTSLVSQIAAVLGKTGDADAYGKQAKQIKDAFNAAFYHPESGQYGNGSQTSNALPLYLDIAGPGERGHAAGKLYNSIVYSHDTHLTTGFIGVKYLLPVLSKRGELPLAYELATGTDYPSWGFMLRNGATTLWELWQDKTGPSMNSQDHAMFGSVGAWYYRWLAGIRLTPGGEGYRKIRIEPALVEDLDTVGATVTTIAGRVGSSLVQSPGSITVEATVPVGTEATVVVPKRMETKGKDLTVREGERVVWRGGQFVAGDAGIEAASATEEGVEFRVGSGRYEFRAGWK
jgi:alpha-L-rhamnosidase